MRYGYWLPVFGGWLRNVPDEGMEPTWDYVKKLAQILLETEDFSWITNELSAVAHRHAAGRIVSVLEGGYDLDALAASVAAHLRVLLANPHRTG